MTRNLIWVLLSCCFLAACQPKKDDAPHTPAVKPAPAHPRETPAPAGPPVKVVDGSIDFVTWNDSIDDDSLNSVVFENDSPQQMRLHFAFRPNVKKFLRVLQVKPLLNCDGGEPSAVELALLHGSDRQELTWKESVAVEQGEDYVLEVVQNLNCKKASGVYQTIVWTGTNEQVEPVVSYVCSASGQTQPLNFFPSEHPQGFLGKSAPFIDDRNFCGQAVEDVQSHCSVRRDGALEAYSCETTTQPERSAFELKFDPLRHAGVVQCWAGDSVSAEIKLEKCDTKVLDRNDFGAHQ